MDLKKKRKAANKTQNDMALELGVKTQSISKWELNITSIPKGRLKEIRDIYHLSDAEFDDLRVTAMGGQRVELSEYLGEIAASLALQKQMNERTLIYSISSLNFSSATSPELFLKVCDIAEKGGDVVYVALPPVCRPPYGIKTSVDSLGMLKDGLRTQLRDMNRMGNSPDLQTARTKMWGISLKNDNFEHPWNVFAAITRLIIVATTEISGDTLFPDSFKIDRGFVHIGSPVADHEASCWAPFVVEVDFEDEFAKFLKFLEKNMEGQKPELMLPPSDN